MERQERPISNVNDYRAADNTYYYDKDARSPYDANGNVYPSVRKHDWGRNNAVIVDSSPPQRKYITEIKILYSYPIKNLRTRCLVSPTSRNSS